MGEACILLSTTDKNKARVHGDSGLACWGQGGFSGVGIDGEIHADSSPTPLLTSRAPSGAGRSHGRRFIDHRGADSWGVSSRSDPPRGHAGRSCESSLEGARGL